MGIGPEIMTLATPIAEIWLKIGLNGGHLEIQDGRHPYINLIDSIGLLDPQNMGVAPEIMTLDAPIAEIWLKIG